MSRNGFILRGQLSKDLKKVTDKRCGYVEGRMLLWAEALRCACVWDVSGPQTAERPGSRGWAGGESSGGNLRGKGGREEVREPLRWSWLYAGSIWTQFQHPDIRHHTVKLWTMVTGRSLLTNVYDILLFHAFKTNSMLNFFSKASSNFKNSKPNRSHLAIILLNIYQKK